MGRKVTPTTGGVEMKIYRFGSGRTLVWFGVVKRKQKENPVIVFTKLKVDIEPEKLGKIFYGRNITFWERLTAVWFVFPDIEAVRFWLEKMLENFNMLYPPESK